MTKNLPSVSIIILNYNGWKDTIECLDSLNKIKYLNYNIILIDNNSNDDSLIKLRKYIINLNSNEYNFSEYEYYNKKFQINTKNNSNLSKKFIFIKNDKNYGFAEGNNIGIRFILNQDNPDYILLLNNDTVVDNYFLNEMLKIGEEKNYIGIIGPKIYYYDSKNVIQATSIKINLKKGTTNINGLKEIDCGQYDNISLSDSIPGSCILIKREVFEKIGLLNSDYFCYWEENEFCFRASKGGYKCIYAPNSIIWHKGSQSSMKITGFFTYYITRNTFWFERSYANSSEYIYFIFYFFIFRFWHQILYYILIQKNTKVLFCFLQGIIDGINKKL